MASQSGITAAIEGQELLVTGQDIKPGGAPIFVRDTMVFPLQVNKRGEGEILKANRPEWRPLRVYSLLEVGDKISGKKLWGFSSNPITANDIKRGGSGRTSHHSGQELKISDMCFLEIVEGWIGGALPIHPKDTELQELPAE
jgi:hypothetical protein